MKTIAEHIAETKLRLIGLQLGRLDTEPRAEWIDYDIGAIAVEALGALQIAVVAFEQIVTGEKIIKSLDIGTFYEHLNKALWAENGMGVVSNPGDLGSLQNEIEALVELVRDAQEVERHIQPCNPCPTCTDAIATREIRKAGV